ncbi:hypothetical protein AMTRI_Chr10g7090 [Amborella trichopoda]
MVSQYSLLVFLSLLCILFNKVKPQPPQAPAIYNFGDSLSDSGNNNFLPTAVKWVGQVLVHDFEPSSLWGAVHVFVVLIFLSWKFKLIGITQLLGLPLPPPYLSLTASNIYKIINGTNYASGGGATLEESGKILITCHHSLIAPQELQQHLSKSIFVVEIGLIDYIFNYLQPELYTTSRDFTPSVYSDLLLQNLGRQLTLYKQFEATQPHP